MISEFSLRFIASGLQEIDARWTHAHDHMDRCFKLYMPLEGCACLVFDTGELHPLHPGTLALINGHKIVQSTCCKRCRIAWAHFVPESLELFRLLECSAPYYALSASAYTQLSPQCIATSSDSEQPVHLHLRVHGLLLEMISHLLLSGHAESKLREDSAFIKIAPALDYLNLHYLDNPSLKELSKLAGLAPNYFHRIFKQIFNTTPYRHMESKRMEMARQLLSTTALSVGEIAEECGYENIFYFSRVFKKTTGRSPVMFRNETNIF